MLGEEALVRAAALQPAAVGRRPQHFGDDVVAIALAIALDDRDARAHRVADAQGLEELPLLARVQVADQVRQVPRQVAVDLGVEEESGGGVGRQVVAVDAGAVARHVVGLDPQVTAAQVLADVDVPGGEEGLIGGHRANLA